MLRRNSRSHAPSAALKLRFALLGRQQTRASSRSNFYASGEQVSPRPTSGAVQGLPQ